MLRNSETFSEREVATVQAIRAIQTREGIPPSYKDIAEELGVSISTTQYRVLKAIGKGLITMQPGKFRSIRLTAAASTVPEPKKKRRAA